MKEKLLNALEGDNPIIFVVSTDERHVVNAIANYAKNEHFLCYSWDTAHGGFNELDGVDFVSYKETEDKKPIKIPRENFLNNILFKKKENAIAILTDIHHDLTTKTKEGREIISTFKNFVYDCMLPFSEEFQSKKYRRIAENKKKLVIVSPILNLPKELENFTHVVEYGLPSREETRKLVDSFLKEKKCSLEKNEVEKIIDATSGLTEIEAMIVIKKIFKLFNGELNIKAINKEKEQIIKSEGSLEIINSDIQINDVGGFEAYKTWIKRRKLLLDEEKRKKFNLEYPKGVMMTGVPGCGKSLIAKAMGNEWGIPLIRFNFGSIFGRYLGESDANLKRTLKVVESLSPCILWIDEIEKSLPTGDDSHETSLRLFGQFLTWMQEKKEMIFIFATANNVDKLPPEFLRKGRFDEIFFVDLPNKEERKKIFDVHINNHVSSAANLDIDLLAEKTNNYSGAEIQTIVEESLLIALEADEELTNKHILEVIKEITPLAVTMKMSINKMKEWAYKNQVKGVSSNTIKKVIQKSNYSESKIGFK